MSWRLVPISVAATTGDVSFLRIIIFRFDDNDNFENDTNYWKPDEVKQLERQVVAYDQIWYELKFDVVKNGNKNVMLISV
ncbi:hypothetical protein [Sphingobacterium multivorum]|uniref:hypothetical protein n=1 Tax=Sphingobacterium multivorum TaxID=28454 RepID=UPI00345E6A27